MFPRRSGIRLLFVLLVATFLSATGSAVAQKVLTPEEAARMVPLKDLQVTASSVSGAVVNNTPHIIRNVELAIEYHWLWANEFKPGAVAPGRAFVIKLDKELRPGESIPFRHIPDPPLESRKDGEFHPEVTVAGFTIVVPATAAAR